MNSPQPAVELALIIIRNGGSTLAAERAFANALTVLGRTGTLIWRFDFLIACIDSKQENEPIIRSIGPMGLHLGRVAEAIRLSERVAAGQIQSQDLTVELARLETLGAPVGLWLVNLAAACAGFSLAQMAGGDLRASVVAFVAAGIGQHMKSQFSQKLSKPFLTILSSSLSSLFAVGGIRLGFGQTLGPAVIGAIVYLVPGIMLINGFIDMTSGRHQQMGIQRVLNATGVFLAIGIGIAIADAFVGG